MAQFGLNDYVIGKNNLYCNEGVIISMHECTGAKKGMLYTIKDDNGCDNSFFEDEIRKLAMPSIYEHTFEEMAKEWYYLYGDKRVARLDLYHNKTKEITKEPNGHIYLQFKAYGKDYIYFSTLEDIKDNFKNKTPRDYAHYGHIGR